MVLLGLLWGLNKNVCKGSNRVIIKMKNGSGDSYCSTATNTGNLWYLTSILWSYYKFMSVDKTYSKWSQVKITQNWANNYNPIIQSMHSKETIYIYSDQFILKLYLGPEVGSFSWIIQVFFYFLPHFLSVHVKWLPLVVVLMGMKSPTTALKR